MNGIKLPQPIPGRLKDKIALITGAAGNIGFETARRFLAEGAKVSLIDIQETALTETLSKLQDAFSNDTTLTERVLTIQADVTDQPDVERFVSQTVERFGGLDTAFFCAGISYSSTSILDTDDELWDRVIKVNTRSGQRTRSECKRRMLMNYSLPRHQIRRPCNARLRKRREYNPGFIHRRSARYTRIVRLLQRQIRPERIMFDCRR